MPSDSVVRARIDSATKAKATEALAKMGLSVSDAIRLLLTRIAAGEALPFIIKTPNAATRAAMSELDARRGKSSKTPEELFSDLGI